MQSTTSTYDVVSQREKRHDHDRDVVDFVRSKKQKDQTLVVFDRHDDQSRVLVTQNDLDRTLLQRTKANVDVSKLFQLLLRVRLVQILDSLASHVLIARLSLRDDAFRSNRYIVRDDELQQLMSQTTKFAIAMLDEQNLVELLVQRTIVHQILDVERVSRLKSHRAFQDVDFLVRIVRVFVVLLKLMLRTKELSIDDNNQMSINSNVDLLFQLDHVVFLHVFSHSIDDSFSLS